MSADHLAFARDRVIIISAPNGARRTSKDHQALPITPAELADCAESLLEEGVSVLHLHVRDEELKHSLDDGRYRSAIDAIKTRVGDALILQITTEAVGMYSREHQMAVVRSLRPEAVSLGLSELCPDERAEPDAARFFAWLRKESVWPQYILYSADDVERFDDMRRRGMFSEDHPFCLMVMGRYSEALEGSLSELSVMRAASNCDNFSWAVCCFGKLENEAMLEATRAGGHVRIGFENNLYLPDGSIAGDNAELINAYCASAVAHGRRPATADEIRNECLN